MQSISRRRVNEVPSRDAAVVGANLARAAYVKFKHSRDRSTGTPNDKYLRPVIEKMAEEKRCPYTIPVINDRNLCLIYSPTNLRNGTIIPYNIGAIVEFEMWIVDGYLRVKAESLPFTFGVPILVEDGTTQVDSCVSAPLCSWQPHSARFDCVIYYLAAAADALDGAAPNTRVFMERVPKHREHRVVCHSPNQIFIEVDYPLDMSVTYARDSKFLWYATLSCCDG